MQKLSSKENGFAVFEVLFFVLLVAILVGAAYYVGKHNSSAKPTTSTASASTPKSDSSTEVVKQTEAAYAAYLKVATSTAAPDFIKSSGYFASGFTTIPGGDYSSLLCDQDIIPKSVTVSDPSINGDKASVSVTKVAPGTTYPSFTVNLSKTNGKWLISSTDCTDFMAKLNGA